MQKFKLRRLFCWIILLCLIFLTVKPLFRSGYYPMHDDIQPMRLYEMDKCIRDFQIPCRWVPDMGYGFGYPQFNYYAPLPYYVMEIFHLMGVGILKSIKVYMVLVSLVSIWGIYKASSKFWESETAGYISAIFYNFLPYRAVNVYVRGAISEYTAQALIPVVLYYFLCLIKDRKKDDIIKFILVLTALFLSHNISALFVIIYLVFLSIFYIGSKGWGKMKKPIAVVTGSFLLSIFLSAFFLLPAFFERQYVHTGTLTQNYFDFRGHFLSIYQILFSGNWGYGSSVYGSNDQIMLGIGILNWFIPLLALILSLKDRHNLKNLAVLSLLAWVSLFLTHPRSILFWKFIPLMDYVQFPWRFNLFAGIFFSLAVGYFGLIKVKTGWRVFLVFIFTSFLIYFYAGFFRPEKWLDITDSDKFKGRNWELAQTISINDYLPVFTELSPKKKSEGFPVILSGQVKFVGVEKGTNWQRWKVETDRDSKVSTQLFYFPGWMVYVDGKEVIYDYVNNNGIITLNLAKGSREVIIKLTDTPIRIIGNMLTLLSIPLILFLLRKFKYEE